MPATQVTQEEKTGLIDSFFVTDSGSIKEDGTGTTRDFYQHGASVDFIVGDAVSYRLITTPSGKVIVAGVVKKPN